jgi:hypothetical protein
MIADWTVDRSTRHDELFTPLPILKAVPSFCVPAVSTLDDLPSTQGLGLTRRQHNFHFIYLSTKIAALWRSFVKKAAKSAVEPAAGSRKFWLAKSPNFALWKIASSSSCRRNRFGAPRRPCIRQRRAHLLAARGTNARDDRRWASASSRSPSTLHFRTHRAVPWVKLNRRHVYHEQHTSARARAVRGHCRHGSRSRRSPFATNRRCHSFRFLSQKP